MAAINKVQTGSRVRAEQTAACIPLLSTTLKGARAAYLSYVFLREAFTFIFSMSYVMRGMRKKEEDISNFYFLPQVVQMDKGSELNANSDAHVDSG